MFGFEDDDDEDGDKSIALKIRDQLPRRMVMPVDEAGEFDDEEIAEFFEKSAQCYGPDEIAWSLGWSQHKLRQFLSDDERTALLVSVREMLNQGMERAVYRAGKGGNVTAQRLWLFCQARHLGWADTRQIHVTAQSRQEVLISVAQGVRETLNAGIIEHGDAAVLALQTAYIDADVIDDDATD